MNDSDKINLRKRRQPPKDVAKKRWTKKEDSMLNQLLRQTPHLSDYEWQSKVAPYFSGRTGAECKHRFMDVVSKGIIRGNFTEDEDACLRECLESGMRFTFSLFAFLYCILFYPI